MRSLRVPSYRRVTPAEFKATRVADDDEGRSPAMPFAPPGSTQSGPDVSWQRLLLHERSSMPAGEAQVGGGEIWPYEIGRGSPIGTCLGY